MKTTIKLKGSGFLTSGCLVSDTDDLKKVSQFRIWRNALTSFLLLLSAVGFAQLVTNPITGTNPNTANPYITGQTVAANVTASGIGRGSGISGSNANDRYNASGFTTSNSISTTDYFEFTITPAAGYAINFASFVYTGQASGSGPSGFAFRSSVDGYTANIGAPNVGGTTISLAGSAYQGRTTATTFRFYGYNATFGSGTYSINSFEFNGAACVAAAITAQPTPTQTVCIGSPVNLSVTAINATSYQWKRNGTPILGEVLSSYSIASTDAGSAGTYTVDVISSCNTVTSANAVVVVNDVPTATGGGSTTTCSNQAAVVSGMTAANGTISWTENGAGSITAGGATTSPTYTPAAGDAGNAVLLTMTVANAPCTLATADYTINVTTPPTAVAGTIAAICSNNGPVDITTGSSTSNDAGITWSHNGTGTIANANSLTLATYSPGLNETGNVTITLTAAGIPPCGNVSSNKILTIKPVPVGVGVVMCQGQSSLSMTSPTVCTSTAPTTSSALSPSAAANSGAGVAWVNTANVYSDNNVYSTVQGATGAIVSQTLNTTGYGFGIPANATITGIQVSVSRFRSGAALAGEVQDTSLRLLKGGAVIGANKGATSTNWPTTEAAVVYGGTADLWSTTWSPVEVNASNFGVALAIDISAGFVGSRVANVDHITIAVTYTVPGDLKWYTVSSGGSSIGTGASFDPVGVAGSGLSDTNTPGTTTYYLECGTVADCRTAVTYVINPLPTVSFTGLGASYCGTTNSILLTGNMAPAGSFSGPGVTDNANGTANFNPATAGAGVHAIVYSYTDGNTCTNTDSQNVTVIAPTTYYADADGDGFGNLAVTELSCDGPSAGFVANSTDCDDGALQYLDSDGDGFGSDTLVACGVTNSDDCDDNALQYLDFDGDGFGSLTEVACGVINNTDCDDNDNTKNTTFPFYADVDGDGYGVGSLQNACAVDAFTPPANYSLNNTDCDDGDISIYQTGTLYVDADNDGYTNGSTAILCYGAAAPSGYALTNIGLDCNDSVFAINPGATEVLYNGIDDNCDTNLDEGNLLTTTLLASACNTTMASINSVIGITTIAGHPITGYRIRVTNGAEVQIIERGIGHFTMLLFASYTYATTYTVEIELQRAGIWLGYYGPSCQISTPAILAEGGAASVSPSQCGITLPKLSTLIATTSIQGVTGYRFRITNLTDPIGPNAVQTIDRALNWFSLPMLTRSNYGTTYQIEVAVKSTGTYGGFGSPCDVSSPSAPSLINCGGTVASANTLVAATSLPGVTQYRFQITRLSDAASSTIDRSNNYFTFNMVPPAIRTAGALYAVRVAVMSSGNWSPLGDACEITSPLNLARPADESFVESVAHDFKAVASPNPFASDFGLNITTSSAENVSLKVYDMMGRMIESTEVKASDLNTTKVGAQYPSGVYNVIVNQSGIVKTLRVIKR